MNIISVLNGSIVKERGIWRTTYFKEKEGFGAGDTLRVVAGYYLYKKLTSNHIETIVLVQGGYGKLAHDMIWMPPLPSAVMKNELIALGVPSECIIEESKSGNTHQQLNILLDIVHEKNPQHISIVSNAYHLPRVKAIIEYLAALSYFKELLLKSILELVPAEEICLMNDREKWEHIIKEAYDSQEMKRRIEIENRGAEDIKNGTYQI